MSVEKFTGSFSKEDGGVTIAVNSTIQSIRNTDALAIYSYLLTKPSTWEVNIEEIKSHFGLSRDKARRAMNNLIDLNLLKRFQLKSGGMFQGNHYVLYLRPHAPLDDSPETENPAPVKPSLYKTKITSLENKDNNNVSDLEKITEKQIIEAYHEVLPDNPKIKVADRKLSSQLKAMVKGWPKYSSSGKSFTIEGFKAFLTAIKVNQPGFLRVYVTKEGNKRQNNLRTITREVNLAKFVNGEFNFK